MPGAFRFEPSAYASPACHLFGAAKLAGMGFFLCSRFCLVNLRHIHSIGRDTLTVGQETLAISRRQYKPIMEALTHFYAGGDRQHG